MKITKTRLKQIIKEELGRVVKESNFTDAYTFTGPGKDAAPTTSSAPFAKDSAVPVAITKIMQQLVRAGVIPEIASIDLDTPITMSPGMTIADAEAALNDESPYNFSKSASEEVKKRVLDRLVQR
tara:strand:+ start:517 stop:891 length:375 start_codon:yes stop_codon:yes gene_type:complete